MPNTPKVLKLMIIAIHFSSTPLAGSWHPLRLSRDTLSMAWHISELHAGDSERLTRNPLPRCFTAGLLLHKTSVRKKTQYVYPEGPLGDTCCNAALLEQNK